MDAKDRKYLNEYFELYRSSLTKTDIINELLLFRDLCIDVQKNKKKLIFVGNGASASISSQAATYYTQSGKVRAIAFNDHNLITGYGNDYGYENWVSQALEAYADPEDVIVLISSSGSSSNIVNAAIYAQTKGLKCVTFSGFSADNPLRKLGYINLWINSREYNVVECTHLTWILLVGNLLEDKKLDNSFIKKGLSDISDLLKSNQYDENIVAFRDVCNNIKKKSGKLIFAGNGGSSSIASHAATDFTKQSRMRSVAFNDHNLLTAFSNDYGQSHWIARSIEAYAEPEDAVILISSSGCSQNILNAANASINMNLPLINFSALDSENNLKKLGIINYLVESEYQSIIGSVHSILLFTVCDMLAANVFY
jgi:D-sedoheptulose 7-phosphate isomerase